MSHQELLKFMAQLITGKLEVRQIECNEICSSGKEWDLSAEDSIKKTENVRSWPGKGRSVSVPKNEDRYLTVLGTGKSPSVRTKKKSKYSPHRITWLTCKANLDKFIL